MKIMLISSLISATGNNTTILRLKKFVESAGHEVVLGDVSKPTEELMFLSKGVDCAIGLHAFHSGKHLRKFTIPFVIILGGTDMNENVNEPAKFEAMNDALTRCNKIVSFHSELADVCLKSWPSLKSKIAIITPAPVTYFNSIFDIFSALQISPSSKLYTLPISLRPVKDPLFLAKEFSYFHTHSDNSSFLVIIGPEISSFPDFANHFKEELKSLPGVLYYPSIPIEDMHAVLLKSVAMVNSSKSEGLSNAILEALYPTQKKLFLYFS